MSRTRIVKTSFSNGEIQDDLLGRGDLRAYENGALALRNVFIHPTGGISRRDGLVAVDWFTDAARLIPFEFNTEQTYLLVLAEYRLHIYEDGWQIYSTSVPYTHDEISQIAWTQSADTLLLVHPDHEPFMLQRAKTGNWGLRSWVFATQDGGSQIPFFSFVRLGSVTVSGANMNVNTSVTINSTIDVFETGHVGTFFKIDGKQLRITAISNTKTATATILQAGLTAATAYTNWQEQAFSAVRGWPSSVTFHQDRLVIGGSRDLPNRLWLSRSGDLFNFDIGTGLDDEAIEFTLLSDQINAIRAVFSGRHLQIFTSGAEWMVTGDPLTPTSIQVNRQTRVGSVTTRYVPPVDVDGATYFVARNRNEVRQFLFTDVEQAYQASDMSMLAQQLVEGAIDMDYDQKRRLLYVVRDDGKFATMTVYRAEQVLAWTLHETDGEVIAVSSVGEQVYVLVKRGEYTCLEYFDPETHLDGAIIYDDPDWPTDIFQVIGIEDDETVSVVADGVFYDNIPVENSEIVLPVEAGNVTIGRKFMHRITPLPLANISAEGTALATRMVQLSLRLKNTGSLKIDTGRGARTITLGSNQPLHDGEALPLPYSGDVHIRAYGWHKDFNKPLWEIAQDDPLPFTLLSVSTEFKINT